MVSEEFARFVESQQETDVDATINWAETRDEWLRELDSLYQKIVYFLQEYIQRRSITYDFIEMELNEPNIGRYSARRMDIRIGRQLVALVPVGTLLIGCKGRVDVEGTAGRGHILLVNERVRSAADLIRVTVSAKGNVPPVPLLPKEPISWVWKIVTNGAQRVFVDLDKENFLSLLMETANA
jgi:hypothetical protein